MSAAKLEALASAVADLSTRLDAANARAAAAETRLAKIEALPKVQQPLHEEACRARMIADSLAEEERKRAEREAEDARIRRAVEHRGARWLEVKLAPDPTRPTLVHVDAGTLGRVSGAPERVVRSERRRDWESRLESDEKLRTVVELGELVVEETSIERSIELERRARARERSL